MSKETEYRIEHDSIGEKQIPKDAYYGVQTLRAAENFFITGLKSLSIALPKSKRRRPSLILRWGDWTKSVLTPLCRHVMKSCRASCMMSLLLTPSRAALELPSI